MSMKLNHIRAEYLFPLIFFPLYLTTSGIYKSEVSSTGLHLGETGLVFPISFFIGVIMLGIIIINIIHERKIHTAYFSNFVLKQAIYFFVFVFFLMLVGVIIEGSLNSLLRGIQIITGASGIIISIYLFGYKKINPKDFFGKVAILFILVICLNFISSYITVGPQSFGPSLQPTIFGIGIYQSRVYYPFIVSLICFMGLPYVYEKTKYFVLPYLYVFGFYIFCLQVRGALISFIILLSIAILLYLNFKVKTAFLTSLLLLTLAFKEYITNTDILGRFSQVEKFKNLNGRMEIWRDIIENMDTKTFLFGNFLIDKDGITAHNQFLQNLDMGGFLLIIPLILIFIFALYITIYSAFMKQKNITFLSLVILVNFIVDLNVNVPISNTNPSIHYWFYWSGYVYYLTSFYHEKEVS